MRTRILPAVAGVLALMSLPGCSRAAGEEDRADTETAVRVPPVFETTLSGRVVSIGSPLSFDLATGPVRLDGAAMSAEYREAIPVTARLATLDAPDPDLARSVLERRLAGAELRLAPDGPGEDRYGRILAQAYLDGPDGADVWLQAELVRRGTARVLSHASNPDAAPYLLMLESEARRAGLGLWAEPAHAVRSTDPDVLAQDDGSVQIVEGRIIEATQLRSGRIYLNFGADYRTDFTVMIAARDADAFAAAGLAPDRLETRRVRVRGWVELENGPMIRIDHPERLEVLPD